jgi:hypothetical protein
MHFKSGSLQSVRIIPPPLTESYFFIDSIFFSSTCHPTFPDPLFLLIDSSLFSLPKIGSNSSRNPHLELGPVLPFPSPVLFLDLLFSITDLRYLVTNLCYPGLVSPYPSSALFSSVLTLFFSAPVLFFLITNPCYLVTTLHYPELVSPYPIADPSPLVSAFLCSSMHTCAQPN